MLWNVPSTKPGSGIDATVTCRRSCASRSNDGSDRCEIDLAVDYRVLPTEPSRYGPTLAIEELAANKVLALFDRAEARDFLDLMALTQHFDLDALLTMAAQKDTGFDIEAFRGALRSFERLTPDDFGTSSQEYVRLRETVTGWLGHLDQKLRRWPLDRGPELGR